MNSLQNTLSGQLPQTEIVYWFSIIRAYEKLVDDPFIHDRLYDVLVTKEYYYMLRRTAADFLCRSIINSKGEVNKRCIDYLLPFREGDKEEISNTIKEWLTDYDASLTNILNKNENDSKSKPFLQRDVTLFKSPWKQYKKIKKFGPHNEKILDVVLDKTVVKPLMDVLI